MAWLNASRYGIRPSHTAVAPALYPKEVTLRIALGWQPCCWPVAWRYAAAKATPASEKRAVGVHFTRIGFSLAVDVPAAA